MSASRASSDSPHEPALRRALELALEYLAGLDEAPVGATVSGAELRQRIDHDRRTEEVMARINATGEALFTGTLWRGKRCMRVSVCSWLTSDRDVERAVAAIAASL